MKRWMLVTFLGFLPLLMLITAFKGMSLQAAPTNATVVVNTVTDENDGSCIDGDCSLRDAIITALPGDTIIFDPGLTGGIIDISANGKLVVNKNLTISGTVPITVSGNNLTRVFEVTSLSHVKFFSMTILDGNSTVPDCFQTDPFTCGGAMKISGYSQVTLTHVVFTHNTAQLGGAIRIEDSQLNIYSSRFISNTGLAGGGVYVGGVGQLVVWDSIFIENTATDGGGAIDNGNAQPLLVYNSLFDNNSASFGGALSGAAYTGIILQNSTLSNNTAEFGGAIIIGVNDSILTIRNSTLTENVATKAGGAIYAQFSDGHMSIENSTISANMALGSDSVTDGGGGVVMVKYQFDSTFAFTNTTIVNNTAPGVSGRDGLWLIDGIMKLHNSIVAYNGNSNCTVDAGTFIGDNSNMADDGSCANFVVADPLLAPLADNGGSTLTHALLPGSPAIDNGNNIVCPATDQRGFPRPNDGGGDPFAICDIGAYEAPERWKVYVPIAVNP